MPRKHQHFKRAKKLEAGRPTSLTPELINEMCQYLEYGVYMETAAALCGISRNSFLIWLKRGRREEDGIFFEFKQRVEAAMAKSELKDVKNIDDQAARDWRASAWRLERKNAIRWGKKDTLKVENDETKKSNFDGDNIHKLICEIINETDKKPSGQDSDEEE